MIPTIEKSGERVVFIRTTNQLFRDCIIACHESMTKKELSYDDVTKDVNELISTASIKQATDAPATNS